MAEVSKKMEKQENLEMGNYQKNIYQRILGVMEDAPMVQREDKKVNNQYPYTSHDGVAKVIHPLLVKHGIVLVPTISHSEQNGNCLVMKLDVKVLNADNPDDHFIVSSLGYGIDGGDKGPGKAYSYAYKYVLLKLFCLPSGSKEDVEADALTLRSDAILDEDTRQLFEDAIKDAENKCMVLEKWMPNARSDIFKYYEKQYPGIDSFSKLSPADLNKLRKTLEVKIERAKGGKNGNS